MIPKIIHYCWFGKEEKTTLVKKCIESWKKYCSDYLIIEWNEENFDINSIPVVKKAIEDRKFAFATDVIRMWVLYNYGGIYLDTDVELVKPYDDLLDCSGFIGFETESYVNSGQCIASEKGNNIIKENLDFYKKYNPTQEDGTNKYIGCPVINTQVLQNHGLVLNGSYQIIDGFVVYPTDYFNPYDDPTGKLNKTHNTYSIHWYSKSWLDSRPRTKEVMIKFVHRLFGTEFIHNLAVKLGLRK